MSDQKLLKQAQTVYKALCDMLDSNNWKYEKNEEKLKISTGANGDDLPIEILFSVDVDKQIVTLLSKLPFTVPQEERGLMAMGVTLANWSMVDGNFDFGLHNGTIFFRLTTCIRESLISKEALEYMLFVSCATVDNYNDKFLMLMKHAMSLDEFEKFAKE